ncbi:MAG: hypothetical protein OER04_07345 [Cyclobacteriaceae bacterium]|nr:hypothetical protein [Cyclobacteriaceae bacterium]
MWFGSFDDSDFETYSGLGFAHSRNGSSWTKNDQNPIFEPALGVKGEQLGLSTGAAVLEVNDIYHLFYGGVDENGQRVINHATSQ